jgi:hypothetical protein
MKYIFSLLGLFIQINIQCQAYSDSIFESVMLASKQSEYLWGQNLYGPILLVDPTTRIITANERDSIGLLKKNGNQFFGILPIEMNLANTAVNWSGKKWAMILLPLPEKKEDRINLIVHELFHLWQLKNGIDQANPMNNHLDQKECRIYLRLELEALKKAVQAENKLEEAEHIKQALLFRQYRQSLYTGSDSTENLLELNEGLAEYTGCMASGRNEQEMILHFVSSIDTFFHTPSYVRSFAYQTIPVYGYLLSKTVSNWSMQISKTENLFAFFLRAFGLANMNADKEFIAVNALTYRGKEIEAEETARKKKNDMQIRQYEIRFVENPHLTIQFEEMQISFDPGNIQPLNEIGTVYPSLRISDRWGILLVSDGALVSSNWSSVTIDTPFKQEGNQIKGNNWTLNLSAGYQLFYLPNGNYEIRKTN